MEANESIGCGQVAVRGLRRDASGMANVYVDGNHEACINNYHEYQQACVIFKSPALQHGRHTIRIECAGRGSDSATDQMLTVAGFLVLQTHAH